MIWTWDDDKSRANERKHGLSFDTAQLVLDDPLHMSRPGPYPGEQRWQTMGMVGNVVLIVVHTWLEPEDQASDEAGRIISARKATAHERRAYEEGSF